MFQEKIIVLKKGIIDYAELVENMIVKTLDGVLNKNEYSLNHVIENDEAIINRHEVEFDETCIDYIARYQPVSRNLRMIISAIKMSNDLERMADHAVNIAQSGLFLISQPLVKPLVDIPKMGDITVWMLKDSINSFVNEDIRLAKKVLERDNEVDNLKVKVIEDLTAIMKNDPKTIDMALKLITIASNLERIADLSTNICEDVVYLTEGVVIKHNQESV